MFDSCWKINIKHNKNQFKREIHGQNMMLKPKTTVSELFDSDPVSC